MSKSGSFKKKRIYFSQVSNNALRDNTLSLKAKGLYGLIQSYLTIEDFTLYKPFLEKQCKEGQKAFDSAWKELKKSGYLVQERYKDENGHFYWQYDLLNEVDHIPNIHSNNVHPSQNVPYGEVPLYNNTLSNNTDLNNTKESNTNLQFLWEIGWSDEVNPYIKIYLDIRSLYKNKRHKRVSEYNIQFIERAIKNIIGNLPEYNLITGEETNMQEEFASGVHDYFKELPEGRDGDIVHFLKVVQPRYFEITGSDIVEKD